MPLRFRCFATSSIVMPAPIRSAVCEPNPAKNWFARLTAAYATETGLLPISVSVRTFLATENVW